MKLDKICLQGESYEHPQDTVISKLFEKLLEASPGISNDICLEEADSGLSVTYEQLNNNANALARVLLKRIRDSNMKPNADRDHIVALRFLPDISLVTTILAIFKAGMAYVPIAPNWPPGKIQQIIKDAEPVFVLTNTKPDILYKAQKSLPLASKREVLTFDEMSGEAKRGNFSRDNLPDNQILNSGLKGNRLFAVLYTSGSTGTPKGVRHVHRAALNRFSWQWRCFPYEENEVCVFKTTLTFVDSVTEIWSPLLSGRKLIVLPTKFTQNVEKFVETLDKFRIGRIFIVTSLVRSILSYVKMKRDSTFLSSVKLWECSAETVTKEVLEAFFDYFPEGHKISNLYGSTEMMDVTYETFESLEDVHNVALNGKIPIGYPLDNIQAYVLDEEYMPVAEGVIGSLYIAGRNVCHGFVGCKKGNFVRNKFFESISGEDLEPEALFGQTENNYGVMYRTGDFASIYNGRLYYEGRQDSQVKVRGHRVDMTEIEKTVFGIEGICRVCVLCFKPGEPNQRLLCYFTTKCDAKLTEGQLETRTSELLPEYSVPKFLKLPVFPLLVNGKIDRQSLLKKYEESLASLNFTFPDEELANYVKPEYFAEGRTLLETVAMAIADGARKPNLGQRFFDIGGDSLNMVIVLERLTDHGYYVSVTDFIISTSLAEVAMAMQTVDRTPAIDLESALKKLQNKSKYVSGNLKDEHKEQVIDMISRSFADKGDLTTLADVTYDVLQEQLDILWTSLIEQNLSIVVYDQNSKPIGACLNFDARSREAEPLCARSAFSRSMPEQHQTRPKDGDEEVPMTVVEFLESVEGDLKDKNIPKELGKFIYTSMLGTSKELTPSENVNVSLFMEQENLRLAKEKSFLGIFTTNSNRLTQMICRALEYEVLSSIQVNQWEDAHGSRPFSEAPDNLVTEIAIKRF